VYYALKENSLVLVDMSDALFHGDLVGGKVVGAWHPKELMCCAVYPSHPRCVIDCEGDECVLLLVLFGNCCKGVDSIN
jgi:hypothetical protein